jgi:hypothetical protein
MASSTARSSLASRRPAERPRRWGSTTVVCSTRTRVSVPSSSIRRLPTALPLRQSKSVSAVEPRTRAGLCERLRNPHDATPDDLQSGSRALIETDVKGTAHGRGVAHIVLQIIGARRRERARSACAPTAMRRSPPPASPSRRRLRERSAPRRAPVRPRRALRSQPRRDRPRARGDGDLLRGSGNGKPPCESRHRPSRVPKRLPLHRESLADVLHGLRDLFGRALRGIGWSEPFTPTGRDGAKVAPLSRSRWRGTPQATPLSMAAQQPAYAYGSVGLPMLE